MYPHKAPSCELARYHADSICEDQEYLSAILSCKDKALRQSDGYVCQYMWS